ncbi:Ubiquitin carboxyl-terminal hydrolase 38 [Amphibalanus amphitrite]|uniref:Ubiquitin carboxyl-terminal hydrolase 38 n=1 Tax=Amphibalanus amphitrite TaxID=1232801 RepID=A0A6A4V016_AMPAM|nr:Ubiquitin carboxyl-terminal hydrolase 38 [Amphibalanus amphitrite]
MVRSTLEAVCNVAINPAAWEQASLPVKFGGLGIRSVEALALPAYIASVNAARPLIRSICPSVTDELSDTLETAVSAFLHRTGVDRQQLPDGELVSSQRAWDTVACTVVQSRLLVPANQIDRARLIAAGQPHTAAWIQAVPVPSLGLHLDDETVRVAVALRLGAPVCEPHRCRLCARPVTPLGHHGLSCQKSAGRHSRHAHLNDVVRRALSGAGFPAILEPVGLDRGDGRRPDGITVFPFREGKCLTWDATCVDTFADHIAVESALKPGAAARQAEERKRQRYADLARSGKRSTRATPPKADSPTEINLGNSCYRRGLVNLGNTCFMNTVLQALFHSDQLRGEVLAARPSPSRPHLAALQRVFAFLAFSERPVYSPGEFQRTALPPCFERGRQHDCSEFLRCFLDALHEEERSPAASPAAPVAQTDPDGQAQGEVVREHGTGDAGAEEPPAGLVRRLLTGRAETTFTCLTCGGASRHENSVTDLHLALPESVTRSLTAAAAGAGGAETAPAFGPAPRPVGWRGTPPTDNQTEIELTVSQLLLDYLTPERLCGDNQYYCTKCTGLRDAERQLRLLSPPANLVVSLMRFAVDRRTGARRKVLTPVELTEWLTVPLATGPPAQYRLYAVIVHAGHSLDAGHYFSFCRASGGGGIDGMDDTGWWRLDDTSAVPVPAATALGRPRRSTEAAYTLLYRLTDAAVAGAAGGLSALAALPGPLRAAVERDNAVFRRERQSRTAGALPMVHDGRTPPGAGCGGDSGPGVPRMRQPTTRRSGPSRRTATTASTARRRP